VTTSLNIQKPQSSVPTVKYQVVVVGAGPYGLSVAAHMMGKGLKVGVFGKPISLWREHMPKGMLLRSYWWAVNLSDPQRQFGIAQYFQQRGMDAPDPLSIETFIDYGLWFQAQAVPNVDETFVANIERSEQHYKLTLVDGRIVESQAIVMAPGLGYYTYRPPEFAHMPVELVTHTADHFTFGEFAGKRVMIIGGGQSALEMSALLHENGADVDLVARQAICWLGGKSKTMKNRTLLKKIRYPKAGISPGWFNWGLENLPYSFQRLPRDLKNRLLLGRGRYGPAGAAWLRPRVVGKVKIHEFAEVQEIKELDGGVGVKLSSNEDIQVDHVVLGTGYRVDVRNLPMLDSSLIPQIQTYRNAPVLNARFESSLPGLYFVGVSSVSSFGPFYRFVVGDEAAAVRVASAVARSIATAR
jgi:pyruvate/2-oxoglutarate dehydrogenase complex dihydrolipoamide dehydrogenase (E3) component